MGTRKNGKIVYKISKDANLDKEIKIDNSKIQNSAERTKALTKEYRKSSRRAIKAYRERNREENSTGSSSKREQASRNYMRNAAENDRKKAKGYFSGVNFNLTPSGIKKALSEGNKNTREAFRASVAAANGDKDAQRKWERENLNDVDRFVLGANSEWAGSIARGIEWAGDVTGLAKEKNPEKRTGSKLLNESERYKSELKEGKSEAAKFALDLGSQLYMIGADLMVTGGRSALIPMAVRSFGAGVNEAYYSGASLAQQGAYGALNAGVEVATEKLGSAGSKFINKKGILDNITEKSAKKIAGAAKRFVKSDKGQNILYHAAKAGIGATEEGLEEAIADAVNPIIQRITYDDEALKQYGDPEYWSDMAYDAAIGAAAGGIMGGISQASEYKRSKNMTREQQEAELEKGLKSDESSESYSYANQLLNQSQRGENILPGQFYDLAKKNAAADNRAAKQYNDIYRDTLDNETFRKAQEGFDEEDVERAKGIAAGRESTISQQAKAVMLKQGVEETQADEYAQSIGRIVAGTAGYADTEVFYGNDAAKEAFKKVTGFELPADNESTRRQVTQYAADATYNLAVNMRADIESEIAAENGGSFRASDGTIVETPVMITSPSDVAKFRKSVRKYTGEVAEKLAADYTGYTGVGEYTDAFNAFYDAGKIAYSNPQRFNFTWANKINSAWREYLTSNAARDAYLAGIKAARITEEKRIAAKTDIAKKGESKAEDKSNKLSETQKDMAKALAEKTGLDVIIAEKLQRVVDGANVQLNGAINVALGTLELSLDSDNLGQALAHELTHYTYALNKEGAKELRDAVLSWYAEEKGMKSLSELLENKQQKYGDEVTAEEEFVADALAGLFSNDKGAESFAQWLTDKSGYSAEQQKSVLQKLIDVIDSIIANIKAMFTGNDLSKVSKDMRQLAKQNQKRAEAVRKIYIDALNKASENYAGADVEENTNESSVKYSKKGDGDSIREQLRTNMEKLKDMKPVADVKYESIKHLNRSEKAKAIMNDYNKKFKGGLERQGFGYIILREDEVTGSLKYLHTDGEFAAFKALPQVLKQGKVIDEHINHKKRSIDTVTIAAPVVINNTSGYMAAAVKVGGKNRYHVHRILMPDGSEFEFNKKTEPIGAGMTTSKGRQGSAVSSASNNRISETDKKSNEKFSMKEPVEETKNLIAVHNLNETKLLKTIKLGGFAMPSIAVTKNDIPHTNFGDISIVFGKETIDPQQNSSNTVYSADAWTPTFPQIEYEANPEAENRIKDIYYSLSNKYGYDFTKPLYDSANYLDDTLTRHGGEEGLVEMFADDTNMMNIFLATKGEEPIKAIDKEVITRLPEVEIEMYDYLVDAIGENALTEMKSKDGESPMKARRRWVSEHEQDIINAWKGYLIDVVGTSKQAVDEETSELKAGSLLSTFVKARNYLKNGAETRKTEPDTGAQQKAIREAVNQKEYKTWLRELYSDAVADSGVYNNKDLYTASGNRRSFKATHFPATLEGIVKAMASQNNGDTKNVSGFYGVKTLRAGMAERFKSIEDMHKLESRLKHLTEEEASEINDALSERLSAQMNEIYNSIPQSGNELIGLDALGEIYMEAANLKKKTIANVKALFKKYRYNLNDKQANDIITLLYDIGAMPVNIFEAKPERIVGFDEIRAAVIPETVSEDVISALDSNKIPYVMYDGSEADRLAKMNFEVENKQLKFSIKETDRSTQKLLRENKKYKQLAADLKQQMRLSKGHIPDKGEINKYVNRLRAEYSSKVDKEQLTNALTNLYGYMADKDAKADQVWDVARSIATDIITNSTYNKEISDYAKGILKDIKSSKVALSETQKQEVAYVYGSYAEYKRMNKGVNASDNGIYLDEKWQEWAEVYPELFDAELTEPEQGVRLAEITKALSEDYVNEFGFDLADATDMLAAEIANEVAQTNEMVTFADKKKRQQAEKIAKEKAKNKEKINAIKQQYKEKYQQGMAEQRAKNNQKLTDQRDKAKEQLARQKAKYEQRAADTRARADRRGIKTQIEKDVKYLTGMLLSPTDTKHIPEGYQSAIARMLAGFDFSTTRTDAWAKKYGHLSRRMLNFANLNAELLKIAESGESDIVVDSFITDLADKLSSDLDGRRIDSLTNAELQDVKTLLKAVRYGIANINNTFSDNIRQTRAEAGDNIISETMQIKDKKHRSEMFKMFDDFLNSSNVKPVDFFEVMGGTAKEVFGAVVDGFDRHIRNVDTAMKYIQSVADKKTLNRLSNDKMRPAEFKLSSGDTVELLPSQVMSLYCLMKRPEAVEHITKGGIVPTSLKYKKKFKTQGIIDDKRKLVTYTDAIRIINSLTEEEKIIADKLQKFMAEDCAAWGNETSMKIHGYKKFNDPNYFPMKSDKDFLESRQTDKAEFMPKLWTAGFTKALTPGANNPIMLDDIFNVVTKHITEMSMYNALAPALLDFERIYNYKQKGEGGAYYTGTTVKEQIRRAYGDKATNYINKLMKDLNNANKRDDKVDTKIPNKLIANYKKAKIGFNFRVLIQQPTAIVRSAMMINPKYLIAAQGKPAIKEMQEHCPIAKWKGWGFYQTDIAPSMKEIILGQESRLDKVFMDVYGKADDFTWSYIWKAVKKEVKKNNPDIEDGSQEFWDKCNERAREIYYRTQVVDSMISRSQIMRNDDTLMKIATSFMAEPTTTFNMMRTETIKTAKEWAAGDKKAAAKRMGTLIPVFITNAVAVSVAAAIADYMRDAYTGDDDEEDENLTPLQKYLKYTTQNLNDNANPMNMLPFLRDIYSLFGGYEITRMDMAAFTVIQKDVERLQKTYEQGEDAKYTYEYCIRQLTLHCGEVFGIPAANITREIETAVKTAFPEKGKALVDSFMYANPDDVNRKGNYAALLSEDKSKSQSALEAIERDAETKYQKYIDEGKSESQAMSAVRSSLSNYYKGAYQAAETAEKSMITSRISQIKVNGRSVWEYADGTTKDFSEWDETE